MLSRVLGWRLLAAAIVVALLVVAGAALAATGTITTVAGVGTPGYSGDGGPASAAHLAAPIAILPTASGGYYIADQGNSRIRYVGSDGQINTVAGSGTQGYSGDNGPATAATFNAPSAIAALPDGSLLIADANNNAIRKISGGTVTTVAGSGPAGSAGDGGQATAAYLRFPFDIAVAADGSYYIADTDNHEIRKVSADGIITRFAGTGTAGFSGDGGPATSAQLDKPEGVAIAPDGSLLIADSANQRIRRVAPDGTISTVAGNGTAGATGDGGPPLNAELNVPSRVTALPDGGFLIADVHNNEIRKVDGGTITTVAGNGTAGATGDGGAATAAELNQPAAVALTADNDYLIADTQNQEVRRVDAGDPTPPPTTSTTTTSATTTSATTTTAPSPPPPAPEGDLTPPSIVRLPGSGTPVYGCRGATWAGLAAHPGFTYTWYSVLTIGRFGTFGGPTQNILVKRSSGVIDLFSLTDKDRGGRFACAISATSATGKTLSATSSIQTLTGLEKSPLDVALIYGDFRIDGIDVFQTVQPDAGDAKFDFGPGYRGMCGGGTPTSWYPDSDPGLGCAFPHLGPEGAQQTDYRGVKLDPDKATTAVVYVDASRAVGDASLPLTVTLHAAMGAQNLRGSLVQTITNPPVSGSAWVSSDERTSGKGRVQFALPAAWLSAARAGNLDLVATVSLPASAQGTYECNASSLILDVANCFGNDTFRLNNVAVAPTLPSLIIRTVQLTDGAQTLRSPDSVLHAVTDLYPGGELMTVDPYLTNIDITHAAGLKLGDKGCPASTKDVRTCREAGVDAAVTQWLSDSEFVGRRADMFLAVHDYPTGDGGTEPGWSNGHVLGQSDVRMMVNDGSAGRPLTAAGHEFGHALGAPHADLTCGGNSNGQVGEGWAPDNRGRLEGTEFDPYDGSGNRTQSIVSDTGMDGKGALYDLMSYCASESNAWVSPFNWERFLGTMLAYGNSGAANTFMHRDTAVAAGVDVERAAHASSVAHTLVSGQSYVIGTLDSSGGQIDRVVPADPDNAVPASEPASIVQVTAYGASGNALSHVGASVERLSNADEPVVTFTAPLPADAHSVTATVNGQVMASAVRTRPPHVRLIAPRPRTRIGGTPRSRLQVRWRSGDPDSTSLQATVEYRPGGGAWTPVYMGPDSGHASIPASLLAGSRNGRIRVTINDGFNQARAVSGAIRVAGHPPHVVLTAPIVRQRLQAGSSTVLLANATDDRNARLAGRRLTWFAGRRRLGYGSPLRVTLPPGRIRLRVVARDGRGDATTVARTVTVTPVPLQVTQLSAPTFVRRGSRSISVRVATTTPAELRAGGRRYAVGARVRALSIRLPSRPAHGQFALRVTVTADGVHQRSVRTRLVVIRG